MAKEMKTYHSHGAGSFVMGFLCLFFVGTYALFALMPMITVTISGGEVLEYTGLDFVIVGGGNYIKQFLLPDLDMSKADQLTSLFNDAKAENFIVNIIANFHWIVSLVSAAAILLSAVVAVFVLLLGLAWIIRGRIFLPKFTKRFAGWAHGFFDTGIAALYGYVYLLSEVLKGKDDGSSATLSMMAYVALGAQVVIAILIGITYRAAFKNRVYEKREKKKNDDDYYDQPSKPGQPQKQGKVPVFEKDIPAGTRSVGDHAYAGDPALTRANIPEGVTSLGSNAFANCRNLETVTIPVTVTKIGANCFYNTPHLKQIRYTGSKEDWRSIKRGGNWLVGAGTTTIVTATGAIVVNPNQ